MPTDPALVTKLEELLVAIREYADPRRAGAEWKQIYKLLQKTDLPTTRVANVVAMRGVDQLIELIDQFRDQNSSTVPTDTPAPDPETCKHAMKAFRKRLKLTQLDDESQINNRNPLSKGAQSKIRSIIPPNDWPQAVWQELARQNKLRYTGDGFYELVE